VIKNRWKDKQGRAVNRLDKYIKKKEYKRFMRENQRRSIFTHVYMTKKTRERKIWQKIRVKKIKKKKYICPC
jgi:hypothetical protein